MGGRAVSARLDTLAAASGVMGLEPDDRAAAVERLPETLKHPQQQAYLTLAAATMTAARRDIHPPVGLPALLESSPHQTGVLPVGALGMPIGTMWQAARALTGGGGEDIDRLADIISGVCRRYDESMRLARANTYLWDNAAAPVDVGSVDVAGLTISTFYAFGDRIGPSFVANTLRRSLVDSGSLGAVLLEISLDMARQLFDIPE
jgi:hypothetical protein